MALPGEPGSSSVGSGVCSELHASLHQGPKPGREAWHGPRGTAAVSCRDGVCGRQVHPGHPAAVSWGL